MCSDGSGGIGSRNNTTATDELTSRAETSQSISKAFPFDVLLSRLLPGGAAHIRMGLHKCAQACLMGDSRSCQAAN